jgi:hypothetical protein
VVDASRGRREHIVVLQRIRGTLLMYGDQSGHPSVGCDRQEFFALSTGTTQFSMWRKPRGKSMAYIIVVGSGGGGGAGFTGAIGTVRGGGGGGGSSGWAAALMPLEFLPDTLYFMIPVGGTGGTTSGANGSNGFLAYCSIAPNLTAANLVLQSGAVSARGGTGGSAAGSAGAGAAGTISTDVQNLWANFGITKFQSGKIGAIGGVVGGGAGAANTLLTSHRLSGGAGGGTTPAANTEFAGGAQTGAGIFPTVAGGTAGGNPGNGNGVPLLVPPFMSYGGVGGGTGGAAGTVGGNGSDGGIGSGGGGGGGGVTFGRGGNGGPGYGLIICW